MILKNQQERINTGNFKKIPKFGKDLKMALKNGDSTF